MAAYFAFAEGLSSIAIRIGAYDTHQSTNWLHQRQPRASDLSAYTSERDLNQLLLRCIETPNIPFAIVAGISNNRFKRLDLTATRDLLGYAPQDDGFEVFRAEMGPWFQQ